MNVRDSEFNRLISEWLELDSQVAPAPPVEAAIQFAHQHPRRRDWLAFLRRDAMSTRATAPVAVFLAIIVLLVLAAGGFVLAGLLPEPSPSPSPEASVSATLRPTVGPSLAPIQTGSAVSGELLGDWVEADGYRVWGFFAAGSEVCTERVRTSQDCLTLRGTDMPETSMWGGGIVTVGPGGELLFDLTRSENDFDPCNVATQPERITWEIRGARLFVETAEVCWVNSDIFSPLSRRP